MQYYKKHIDFDLNETPTPEEKKQLADTLAKAQNPKGTRSVALNNETSMVLNLPRLRKQ